jgi:hypothetical protein
MMRMSLSVVFAIMWIAGGQPLAQATKPATAYEGDVGGWALGHWKGLVERNVADVGLQSVPFAMVIQQASDGAVVCRYSPSECPDAPWAPKCRIDATRIQITTLQNSSVELGRTSTGDVEGIMRAVAGSSRVSFSR